ncbi:MAG: hypothetical protein GX809_05850, partial [Clostridiaceae bacterium]|nr:hypothetical protein [Clostridiaceae bacterium]
MLAKFSVKRPYTVVVAVVLVLILGIISFLNLETDLLPSFDLPYVLVMTSYPGASPEEVEVVVTKPLEQVMATVSNIKHINSVSSENSSVVILEFNNDTNMDSATIEINGLLDLVKSAWPDGIGSPMLMRLNPDMLPIMIASVDIQDMDMIEISQKVQEDVIPKLESIPGLASVSATGLLEERVEVLLESDKLTDLNKRLLNKVDKELSEAEDQLLDARSELEEGLDKLDAEEQKQTSRLDQGGQAIRQGRRQLDQAKDELLAGEKELLRAEAELRDKRIELIAQENNIKAIKGLLDELENNIGEAAADWLEQQGEIRAGLLALISNLPQPIKDAMGPALQTMEERLQETGPLEPDEILQMTENLKEGLDQTSQLLAAGLVELESGLAALDEKKQELSDGKKVLEQKLGELGQKEQELTVGKVVLKLEMDRAREKLSEGETILDEKMAEFEEARDQALKKASLDGVLTKEMISAILAAQNFSMPAGSLTDQGQE